MEWIDLATKGLWVLLLGLAMGVGAMRIRARRNRLRFVEFSGDGVGEEAGGWRVEFDVPLSHNRCVLNGWMRQAQPGWNGNST